MEVVELQHGSHDASIQPYLTRFLISATPFGIGASFGHNVDLELKGWAKGRGKVRGRREKWKRDED